MAVVEVVIEIILNIEVEGLTGIHVGVTVRVQLQPVNHRIRLNQIVVYSNFTSIPQR